MADTCAGIWVDVLSWMDGTQPTELQTHAQDQQPTHTRITGTDGCCPSVDW